MAGHWGGGTLKNQVTREELKTCTTSVDMIFESCLIWMVFLLWTCARPLVVDCIVLNLPCTSLAASPVEATRWHNVCQTVLHHPLVPESPFPRCLPSVTCSVTSPSWLLVVNQPGGSLSPFPLHPPPQKKTLKWDGEGRTLMMFLCVLPDFLCAPLPPCQTSCIHPFAIHPSVDHQWHHRAELLEEVIRSDGYGEGRHAMSQVL